jgi:putative redox protein
MTSDLHVARATANIAADAPKYRVVIRSGDHELVADEPPSNGGADTGTSPFGLLLSGLIACTAITLRMYAERKEWPATPIEVEGRYDIADDGTRTIARTVTLPAALDAEQRQRMAEIAEKTPVTKAVRAGTPIVTAFL